MALLEENSEECRMEMDGIETKQLTGSTEDNTCDNEGNSIRCRKVRFDDILIVLGEFGLEQKLNYLSRLGPNHSVAHLTNSTWLTMKLLTCVILCCCVYFSRWWLSVLRFLALPWHLDS